MSKKNKTNATILTEDLFNAAGNATVASESEVLTESTEEETVEDEVADTFEVEPETETIMNEDEVIDSEETEEIIPEETEDITVTVEDSIEDTDIETVEDETTEIESIVVENNEPIKNTSSDVKIVHNGYSDDELYEE